MDVLNGYRTNHRELSSDESENSDNECAVWKRATKKPNETETPMNTVPTEEVTPAPTEKPKRRRNTVWSDVLQDQLISEDLSSCLLKNKPAHYDSRGQESYDYTLKYANSENSRDSDITMDEDIPSESESKFFPSHKDKCKKFVKLDSAERAAAMKINKVLHEKKVYLIFRIVKYVGIEKAMALLRMTEEIEENGGMMIKSNARRRTPGGVYIQLLKTDKDVTKEMLDKIFEAEMSAVDMKRHYAEQKKRRQKKKHKFPKGTQPNKTQCEDEEKSMEIAEICEEAAAQNSGTLSMENYSTPIPAPPESKADLELEEGEIED